MSSLGLDKLSMEDRMVLAQSSGLMAIFEDPISFEIMVCFLRIIIVQFGVKILSCHFQNSILSHVH
jgi:hypothetical protein